MLTAHEPPARSEPEMSEDEWNLRVDLAAAYRLVALRGWDDLIFTHLSARIPGPDHHFLMNPYNMMFEEITASSLVKVDLDGNRLNPSDPPVIPAGFVIHSAIHAAREDVGAVFHLHTPDGQAVSAMADGLLPQTQTAMTVTHDLAYHDYEGVATDPDERKRLVADLGSKNFMILRNHGTLAVGATVAEAYLRMYVLERACEVQVRMLSAGRGRLTEPDDGLEAKVGAQTSGPSATEIADKAAWPALLRKLERIDPSYRT